ncbi:MAG: tryptophan synthase subunit alpha [Ignavibacteriales bacterium]|nr:tryptophan synthase subunit alpha [Ignavibacteriales bacterium]
MNRITTKLQALSARKEKALVCFLTAGFPTLDATLPLVSEIEKGGADIIELGMPFSDPLAEGPVIQHSSHVALQQGTTLDKILSYVKTIRRSSEIPLVLMGYLNPILTYGAERFFRAAAKAGVDGVILPELPLEESKRYKSICVSSGLANIILVTPTTPPERIAMIDRASEGFLYCVSTTGVTGSAGNSISSRYIGNVKKSAKKNPVLVGFGIKTPADAHRIAQYADGVIIGSALVQRIARGDSPRKIGHWVRQLKKAL